MTKIHIVFSFPSYFRKSLKNAPFYPSAAVPAERFQLCLQPWPIATAFLDEHSARGLTISAKAGAAQG